MKRLFSIAMLAMLLFAQPLWAETENLRVSVGGGMVYDPVSQDPTSVTQVSLGYAITPRVEFELRGMTTGDFELENDLTKGKASLNAVTIGTRFITPADDDSAGFVSLAVGALELESDTPAAGEKESRKGFISRLAVGVDFHLTEALSLTLESGFSRGLGQTNEILLFDAVTALSYRF